jgi:hypothetical protein
MAMVSAVSGAEIFAQKHDRSTSVLSRDRDFVEKRLREFQRIRYDSASSSDVMTNVG